MIIRLMYGLLTGIFIIILPVITLAQNSDQEFEEITIYLRVEGIGGFDINCLLSLNDNRLFLPVTDLFTLLKVNQETSPNYDSVKGFFIDEEKRYKIDYINHLITIGSTAFTINEQDMYKSVSGLYIYTGVFGKVFGLYCNFNFRALSVELKTDIELPAIRELRLAQMRKNIEALKGEVVVDTVLKRKYHLLNFGMLDWSLYSTQTSNLPTDNRLSAGIGAELLGGETNVVLNYSTRDGFDKRNQQYLWRWANNDIKLIKQVRVGKIPTGAVSTIYEPVIGVSVTNTPTAYRRSFGLYTITDYTEPGWSVELYINNVLVNYVVADASGFFKFDIPLVYGSSDVTFKFYGPYGEQRIRTQSLNIPYNFLPKGEIEYTLNGGMVQDSLGSVFSRGEVNYGINRFVTVGSGFEYLSSIPVNKNIPFINASVTPHANILIGGVYNYNVVTRGKFTYRNKSNVLFEIDYSKYEAEQKAINYNYLEERKLTLAFPVKYDDVSGYSRFAFKQNVYEDLNYSTAEVLLSAYLGAFNVNFTTLANWVSVSNPVIGSNLGIGFRIKSGLTLRSLTQFDFTNGDLVSNRFELEAKILRSGYFLMTYDDYFRTSQKSIEFSFRYDLPFAQTNASVRYGSKILTTTEGARGSLAFGSGNGYIHSDNRSVVGRGGVSIIPFLDINHNSILDEEEQIVFGLDVRINGGRMISRITDSIIRIVELEPYTSYLIEMDNNSFDNIAWQLKHKAMKVYVDPNQFKKIEIPILPMGEINGMVYLKREAGIKGIGRVLLNIYNENGELVNKIMSEQDGYYTFLGLAPGKYQVKIDPRQIEKLGLVSKPEQTPFEIKPDYNGDIIDGIDFMLSPLKSEKSEMPAINPAPENNAINEQAEPKTENIPMPAVVDNKDRDENRENQFSASSGDYFVQVGAFNSYEKAQLYSDQKKFTIPYLLNFVNEGGMVKLRFGYFKTNEEAMKCKELLDSKGYPCFIGVRK